jgi:short-subunit dehydrogenase
MQGKKKILFVGAGGELASKLLPTLSQTYDIVGIAGKRDDLRRYCVDMYRGDLIKDHRILFETACRAHTLDAIIWNPVRYFFTPFLESTRESLHIEFDLAVALPVECIKIARKEQNFTGTVVLISSMSAFGYRKDLATYSLVKNAQIKLAELLSLELGDSTVLKVVAPASVRNLAVEKIARTFIAAIENSDATQMLYTIEQAKD